MFSTVLCMLLRGTATRRSIEAAVVSEVQQLCADGKCNANEVDPEFGTTPLHWARLHGN
jgi:hypothetical protein